MTIELSPLSLDDPARYRICAQGRFSPDWLDMLSGEWTIADDPTHPTEATVLVGQVLDQAALLGVLMQIYNMGLPLLSVEYVIPYPRRP